MKNSKEYSKKVQQLYRSLKRKYPKVQKVVYDEPVEAIVYAVISEKMKVSKTQSAVKDFTDYFVDFNELRVSRPEEILEVLGEDTSVTRDIASLLTRALGAVFSKYNTVSLQMLKKIGKRPAKQVLEAMDGISRFVADYCMLTALQGHAIPLTEVMIDYLRDSEFVHPDADEQEIGGFLARQISAEKSYEFYSLLRRQSESSRVRKKKKVKKAKKAKTKKETAHKATPKTKKKTKKTAKSKNRKK